MKKICFKILFRFLQTCVRKKYKPKDPELLAINKKIYLLRIARNHERRIEEAVNMA